MINITNLTSVKKDKKYVFSDLNLFFNEKQVSGNFRNGDVAAGNDLVIDFDDEAVKNSIRNLLFQKRYLSSAGANLRQYIGETISEMNAIALGEAIERTLALYEPRIKLQKIYVSANVDQSSYFISMIVNVVNFNRIVILNASFDINGTFQFVNI